jgi:branched-subunit amino acid aminotransferase/4-amino-4-deoxychorismate lyase
VFWRKGNDLFFPDHSLSLYQGITLQMVLIATERMGMNIFPVSVGLEEIPDEVQFYLCNSLKRIVPVASIDEKSYGRDPIFEEILQKAYKISCCF